MKDVEAQKIKKKIRVLLILFVLGLAFGCQIVLFVTPELAWLNNMLGPGTRMGQYFPNLSAWINHLNEGITETYSKYPFVAYCMDWLAFAQLAFIIFFIGAIIDPVRNMWIIKSGMVSFGFIGLIVLYLAYKNVKFLEKIQKTD
jgi:hypothetical protein